MKTQSLILAGLLFSGAALANPMFSLLDNETVNPEILTDVSYQDYAHEYVNYDQASTSLSGSVSCLSPEAAQKLADDAKKEIEKIFAEVGPSGDLAKLDVVIGGLSFEDQIVDNHRIEKDGKIKLVFFNKCLQKEVAFHENLEKVASASVKVSMTSDLTAESTEKLDAAVDKIEAYAEAIEQSDAEAIEYESLFTTPLRSKVQDKLASALATEFKKLDNGEYEVTRTKRVDYNVRYYIADENSNTEKTVTGLVAFPIQTQSSGTDGIFGQLSVSITQDCFASEDDAYNAFESFLDPSAMRELKGDVSDPESDNLRRGKLSVTENNQQRSYRRYENGSDRPVTRYYSACAPEKTLNAPLTDETVYYSASISHTLKLSEIQKLETYAKGKSTSEAAAFGSLQKTFKVNPALRLDTQRDLDLKNTVNANAEADKQAKAFKEEKGLKAAYLVKGYPRREIAGGGFTPTIPQNKAVYQDAPFAGAPTFAEEEGKELIQIFHTIAKQAVWKL